jgi:NMD protein affecting ribosome stability and mRNA decay
MEAGMKRNENPTPMPREGRRSSGRAQDDHILDPYKQTRKLPEPSFCRQCGAVYHAGRWQWGPQPSGAEEVVCQACHRINDRYPAGVVTLTGSSVAANRAELTSLARHQEASEKQDHPLNRIINIEESADGLVISTTDIHLPARIGKAIHRAFRGELKEHFDESGYFARVTWHRDD